MFLLIVYITSIFMLPGVVNSSRNHHCSELQSLPSLQWNNYTRILEKQQRSLMFPVNVQQNALVKNIVHQDLYTDSDHICNSTRFRFNIDHSRKPVILMEKTCARQIIFLDGISEQNRTYECRPESMYVTVWRRSGECIDGVRQYVFVWEKVHVGCSAVRVSSVHQRTQHGFSEE